MCDMLADLRHYCDAHKLEFHRIDKMAYQHYTEEVVEERSRR